MSLVFCPTTGCELGGEGCEKCFREVFSSWKSIALAVMVSQYDVFSIKSVVMESTCCSIDVTDQTEEHTQLSHQRQSRTRKQHLLSHWCFVRHICDSNAIPTHITS